MDPEVAVRQYETRYRLGVRRAVDRASGEGSGLMKVSVCARNAVLPLCVLAVLSGVGGGSHAVATATGNATSERAVIDRYCVSCHNLGNKANAGNLDFRAADVSIPSRYADTFEKAIAKLRAGLMPPPGA